MAAAFDRAGFEAFDVHMSDLIGGRFAAGRLQGLRRLRRLQLRRRARCRPRLGDLGARTQLRCATPSPRSSRATDSFALGVCNGCQMLSQLKPIIPGAQHWPKFLRNRSEQFEARLGLLEVVESPSLFFRGMAGSRIPVAVAHGEGRAEFDSTLDQSRRARRAALHRRRRQPATRYPPIPTARPTASPA